MHAPVGSILTSEYLGYGHGTIGSSTPLASSLSKAMAEIPAANEPDIVLVLAESWGLPTTRGQSGANAVVSQSRDQ
jgi:hypothetical protein